MLPNSDAWRMVDKKILSQIIDNNVKLNSSSTKVTRKHFKFEMQIPPDVIGQVKLPEDVFNTGTALHWIAVTVHGVL